MPIKLDGSTGVITSTSSLTTGSVLFAGAGGGAIQDNANFFWDDTNNYLGIGTATPAYKLSLLSSASRVSNVNSTNANGGGIAIQVSGADNGFIGSDKWITGGSLTDFGVGSAGANNLVLSTNYVERARIDATGNLGLGVTPSAWSAGKAFEIGSLGTGLSVGYGLGFNVASNAYYNGAFYYGVNGPSTRHAQQSGEHRWFNAPSGTAGNPITFTQAMTLDASGNLGVGETSPSTYGQLVVKGGSASATSPILALVGNSFLGSDGPALDFHRAGFTQTIQARIRTEDDGTASSNLTFWTKNTGTAGTLTKRMVLDNKGRMSLYYPTVTSSSNINEIFLSSVVDQASNTVGALNGITFRFNATPYTAGSLNRAAGIYGINTDAGVGGVYARSAGLVFYTSDVDAAATEKMRIDSSGNIFAPYNTQSSKLVVGGNGSTSYLGAMINIRSPIAAGATINYAIHINDANTNTAGGMNLIGFSHNTEDYSNANVRAAIGATIDGSGAGSLVFRTGGFGNQSTNMIINSGGGVGINTTSTTKGKLTINSTPSQQWTIDCAPPGSNNLITLANNAIYDMLAGCSGLLLLQENSGAFAALVMCNFGTVSIIWQYGSVLHATANTSGKLNIFYNAATNSYRFQNLYGSTLYPIIVSFKTRDSA